MTSTQKKWDVGPSGLVVFTCQAQPQSHLRDILSLTIQYSLPADPGGDPFHRHARAPLDPRKDRQAEGSVKRASRGPSCLLDQRIADRLAHGSGVGLFVRACLDDQADSPSPSSASS